MGQKQKTERKKEEEERLNDGENNGQATHGARKHAWRTQAACARIEQVKAFRANCERECKHARDFLEYRVTLRARNQMALRARL